MLGSRAYNVAELGVGNATSQTLVERRGPRHRGIRGDVGSDFGSGSGDSSFNWVKREQRIF